ncbi:MAG TPA: nucleotidyltransferase domain-containing protein [Thermomicrobiales bacterium]|jgi:predicted nucleotidyltransferase|nr:nucleotidyltransferase domain-containing protein [Thermomicrobiales bacterium]
MNLTIERHREEIADLCREYGVKRLELFGSAASDRFDPSRSDFDFVIEFEDADTDPRIHIRYIDFSDAMESLLGRPIDLLTDRALKPRFRAYIQDQRQLVYESTDRERAA